jgi:hypothetical protein
MQYHGGMTGKPEKGTMNTGGLYKRQMTASIKDHVTVEDIDKVLCKQGEARRQSRTTGRDDPRCRTGAFIRDSEGNSIGVWTPERV